MNKPAARSIVRSAMMLFTRALRNRNSGRVYHNVDSLQGLFQEVSRQSGKFLIGQSRRFWGIHNTIEGNGYVFAASVLALRAPEIFSPSLANQHVTCTAVNRRTG